MQVRSTEAGNVVVFLTAVSENGCSEIEAPEQIFLFFLGKVCYTALL